MQLKEFVYQFDAGPFHTKEELMDNWTKGNCRRMLQLYFFKIHQIFLTPEQILCPKAYYETGDFVFTNEERIDFAQLQKSDIIYSERIRDKNGNPINKKVDAFANIDDYITALHTAIYTATPNQEILHATSIEGKSCQWSLEKFTYFYRPIAVKRILQ